MRYFVGNVCTLAHISRDLLGSRQFTEGDACRVGVAAADIGDGGDGIGFQIGQGGEKIV